MQKSAAVNAAGPIRADQSEKKRRNLSRSRTTNENTPARVRFRNGNYIINSARVRASARAKRTPRIHARLVRATRGRGSRD